MVLCSLPGKLQSVDKQQGEAVEIVAFELKVAFEAMEKKERELGELRDMYIGDMYLNCIKRFQKQLRQKFYSDRIVDFLNSLPGAIVNRDNSFDSFKKEFDNVMSCRVIMEFSPCKYGFMISWVFILH